MLAAKARFDAAIAVVGPDLADIAWRVVCAGEAMAVAERELAWPVRSGRLVLKIALDRLAVVVGDPRLVERLLPDLRAGVVAAEQCDRATLVDHLAETFPAMARHLEAPVPAGRLRVLAALRDDAATVADVQVGV
jgi:hypothetical protein